MEWFVCLSHTGGWIFVTLLVRGYWGKETFIFQASNYWNNLDNDIKNRKSLSLFKTNRAENFLDNTLPIVKSF